LLIGKQIQESQIIKYDFNDPLLSSVTYLDLYKQILEKANKNKINYLFLDEIQEVKEFEKCVTGLFEHKTIKFDIYLTGSNSHMFSEQLATLLGGRKIEIQILPLTYYELKNSDIENNIDNYLIYGGMGEIVEYYKQHKLAEMKIKQIFNDTIKNDIINRYNIRNKEEFTKIIEYSFKTIGKHLNPQNIFDFLHSNKQKVISKPSIIRMHNQICSSIVLNKVKYYNTKAKTSLNSKAKYYAGDLGMFSAIVGFNPNDSYRSVRIENLVFLQLKKLNYEVYTSIDYLNREIDFVAVKNNTKKYIQVCDELNENNYERESRSLL
jgi:predicted AAA+ superfamily ATPase